ncbi:MAG: transporter substrate-binding domain-containing protein [Spirochaetales bacterium]|jgi:ABC-type amino acid transport substrate-binding protein|nr:transporter substrate-binding domain-containing protein [Spirochaetales bacterium]
MAKIIFCLFALMAATSSVFAGGSRDSAAPFNDHDIEAVHRIHYNEIVRIGIFVEAPFVYSDSQGVLQGYDVYFARRLGKEILGNENAVLFIPVNADDWAEALNSGKADIVLPGFSLNPEAAALADFALPYRKSGEGVAAPAVRKGNSGLALWLNDVISRRLEADFFHKAYEATLPPLYGNTLAPEDVVIRVERNPAGFPNKSVY